MRNLVTNEEKSSGNARIIVVGKLCSYHLIVLKQSLPFMTVLYVYICILCTYSIYKCVCVYKFLYSNYGFNLAYFSLNWSGELLHNCSCYNGIYGSHVCRGIARTNSGDFGKGVSIDFGGIVRHI